jgi:hypothetical protein
MCQFHMNDEAGENVPPPGNSFNFVLSTRANPTSLNSVLHVFDTDRSLSNTHLPASVSEVNAA